MLRIALTAVGVHDQRPRFDLLLLDGPRTNASGSAATDLLEPAFVEGRRRTKVIGCGDSTPNPRIAAYTAGTNGIDGKTATAEIA